MEVLKKYFEKNKVFFVITLLVIVSVFINFFFECIGKNPFVKEEKFINPVKLCTSKDKIFYVSNSSYDILITDNENRLLNIVNGENFEKTFNYADEIAVGENNNFYVHDKSFADDGVTIVCERILEFNSNGKRLNVLYQIGDLENTEEDTTEVYDLTSGDNLKDSLEDITRLDKTIDSLKVIDGTVYFNEISKDDIKVIKLGDNGLEEVISVKYKNDFENISDSSFYFDNENNKYNIAIAIKNGDVLAFDENDINYIYSAREHDNDTFFSLISEIAYNDKGDLYLCDIGQRQVYRINKDDNKINTVISKDEFSTLNSDLFSETPLYTGLDVSNGIISVLTAEYIYDEENDEEIYNYSLASVSEDGNTIAYNDSVGISLQRRLLIIFVYICIIIFVLIFIYAIKKIINLFKENKPEQNIKMQLAILCTALLVTLGVAYVIFDKCNQRFKIEAGENLCNIAYLIGEKLNDDDLKVIDNPDAYFSDEYKNINKSVKEVLESNLNKANNVYCVIYKVKNDIVCEAYRNDLAHSDMYPMAGKFKDSIEEQIANDNDYDIEYEFALSEGTYMYALIPIYYQNGETAGFIETGKDYSALSSGTNDLYKRILMLATMSVIIVMLLLSEVLFSIQAVKVEREAKRKKLITPPDVIRPLSFLFFVVANISTAFLPIYGMQLWNDSFPINPEIAAAFPISAEFICAAISSFACGFLVRKFGVKCICVMGGSLYVAGNILSAFAGNLWVLICANALCGIGSGCLSLALNTWAASYEDEESKNRGFIHINAAYLSGLNCGTVIGSIIWEMLGIKTVYFVGSIIAVVLIVLILILITKIGSAEEEIEDDGTGSLKDLISPPVIRYFICICVPYLICTAFLEYFFPIEAELSGLSGVYISMAFLLSGMISIYTSSSLAEPITAKLGTKKAMVLASFIYAMALIYLVLNPSILSCYVVVVLFAIADSFGLSAQAVYFSSMAEVKKAGQSRALGVNSTVESITSACGSLIFGVVLTLGTQKGIFIIALVFVVTLIVYTIFDKGINIKEDTSSEITIN